jgi:hypothetical protein
MKHGEEIKSNIVDDRCQWAIDNDVVNPGCHKDFCECVRRSQADRRARKQNRMWTRFEKVNKTLEKRNILNKQFGNSSIIIVDNKLKVNCGKLTIIHIDTKEEVIHSNFDDFLFYVLYSVDTSTVREDNPKKNKTKQSIETTTTFLDNNNIKYIVPTHTDFINIFIGNQIYEYHHRSGKWGSVYINQNKKIEKYYSSQGIEDFYNRFLLKKINQIK